MANTTNFGWETPDDTDLVKDGAAAMRTLGNSIDASFVDLKGGTTGQVLAKASNTDLDFTWSSVDPLTILDAKGDLITATAADTPARLAVGTNGQVLTADSTASTGLKWATSSGWNPNFQLLNSGGTSLSGSTTSITGISGKNALIIYINGMSTTNAGGFTRFRLNNDSASNIYNYYQIGRSSSSLTLNSGPNTFYNLGRIPTTDAAATNSAIIFVYGTNATGYKFIQHTSYSDSNLTGNAAYTSSGYYAGTSTISSVDIVTDDTFDAGTVFVYGA